jgi:hypothetical protein
VATIYHVRRATATSFCRDLMADGGAPSAKRPRGWPGGVVAVHWVAGCPSGQSRTNVPAAGGAGVRIR